jgi:EAL domain-containing protein (putative c-di-GMP-specific phosphodiesterase class I)
MMDQSVDQSVDVQKGLAERLITSLRQGGFVLYRQEIMPLGGKARERPFQEILIRFREEEEKLLPPGTFLPVLEEYRLLPFVDRWVVSQLAKRMQLARTCGEIVSRCSVNLAGDTLHDPNFAEFTHKHIHNAQLDSGTMSFEVSWDTALDHTEKLRALMARLRPSGCLFSIAGFDASKEAFELLAMLEPDFVKLGYGLVHHVVRTKSDLARTQEAHARCRQMGIRTIAEHVESIPVLEALRRIGIDYAQGLAISGPRLLA